MKSHINTPSVRAQSAFGRFTPLASIVAAGLLAAALSSQAATTYTWVTDAGGEYGVAANWNPSTSVPGTTPSLNDVAQIGVASHLTPGTVLYDQSGYNYGFANSSLQIGAVANSTASITLSAGTLSVTNTGGIGFALGNANPSTGAFTNNGGTLFVARPSTANQYFQDVAGIGQAVNGTGRFVNISGQANFLGGIEIGDGNPSTGTFTVSGGTVVDNGWFGIGRANNSSGTFNLSGGIVCILRNPNNDGTGNAGGVSLSQGVPATSVANISGGALYCTQIRFNTSAGGNETLNVSGGDIYVGWIGLFRQGAAASQTINISGGTFHTVNMVPVLAGSTIGNTNTLHGDGTNWVWDANLPVNLMDNTFSVNGQTGPGYVTFAPEATRTITLSNAWNGVGGLVMNGPGTLALYGNSSYSGPMTISGGTVSGIGSVQGDVTANSASTIAPGTALVPGTLTLGASLTLNGDTNIIKLSADPTTIGSGVNDLLISSGNLTLQNLSTIKVVPLAPLSTASPYTVIQYSGTLSGDASNLRVISDSPRYSFTVVNPATTPGSIQVSVTGNSANLSWRGGAAPNPSAWDHTTANWFNTGTSSSDVFYNADVTTFDDNGTVTAVNVIGGEQPASISMANNAKSYVFSGDGLLAGALDAEGSGTLTLSLSQAPAFSTINLNSETLAFALSNGLANTVSAPITDNGGGTGTIIQGGTNTLVLSGNNSSFTGKILITNGVLQYADAAALGAAAAPLYVTNNGSLDLNGVVSGLKNIIIAGNGFNGRGALINSSATALVNANGVNNLTLVADASIGALNRWDVYQNSLNGNGFKLTEVGPGSSIFQDDGETALGDIHIVAGRLGFQGNITMGDPAKTVTVESNATLTFFSLANGSSTNGGAEKTLVLQGNAVLDSGGASNNFNGPVFLAGTNLIGTRSTLHLWGNISDTNGPGGILLGADAVGASAGDLWLDGINTYSGPTIITNRTLFVGPNSSLGVSSLIQVSSGAKLDVSALATFQLGAGRTLIGNGTVGGHNIVFGSGATLAPGLPGTNTSTLTINGVLTLQPGSTNIVVVNKTGSVANDKVAGLTSVTMGGTLVINSVGNPLASGDAIQLFSASDPYGGLFNNIIPPTPGTSLVWDSSTLNSDGMLRVLATGPSPNPTNITFAVLGNQLTLSWPTNHTGWTLQAQTNNSGVGITTNWLDVPGSATTNRVIMLIDAANGSVFYRMSLHP